MLGGFGRHVGQVARILIMIDEGFIENKAASKGAIVVVNHVD